MPLWLRLVLLAATAILTAVRAMQIQPAVSRRLVTATRGSTGRAVAVGLAYYLLILVVALAFGGVAAGLDHTSVGAVGVPLTLIACLLIVAPYCWCLLPGDKSTAPGAAATSYGDFRKARAPRRVARALTTVSVVCSFVVALPVVFVLAIVVLVHG